MKGHQRYATIAGNNLVHNTSGFQKKPEKMNSKLKISNKGSVKRSKNQTVTGSESMGRGLNLYSPQNLPSNSLAFSFAQTNQVNTNLNSSPANQHE